MFRLSVCLSRTFRGEFLAAGQVPLNVARLQRVNSRGFLTDGHFSLHAVRDIARVFVGSFWPLAKCNCMMSVCIGRFREVFLPGGYFCWHAMRHTARVFVGSCWPLATAGCMLFVCNKRFHGVFLAGLSIFLRASRPTARVFAGSFWPLVCRSVSVCLSVWHIDSQRQPNRHTSTHNPRTYLVQELGPTCHLLGVSAHLCCRKLWRAHLNHAPCVAHCVIV